MVTVVNQPPAENRDSGLGTVVAVVLIILLVLVVLFWGGPIVRRFGSATPTISTTNPPNNVDVNINNGSDSTNQTDQTQTTPPYTTTAPQPTNAPNPTGNTPTATP